VKEGESRKGGQGGGEGTSGSDSSAFFLTQYGTQNPARYLLRVRTVGEGGEKGRKGRGEGGGRGRRYG